MTKTKLSMHNHYIMYKESPSEPKHKVAEFDNIMTAKGYAWMSDSGYRGIAGMRFGSGSVEPSESDTGLTKEIFTGSLDHYSESEYSDDSLNFYMTFKVPADTSHVGEISEVGIVAYNSNAYWGTMLTHALVKDAEGNPITITKTDTEVLYVDVHVKYELSSSGGFTWNYNYPLYFNAKNINVGIPPLFSRPRLRLLGSVPDILTSGLSLAKIDGSVSYNASNKTFTFANNRFGTDVLPTQRYINAIAYYPCITMGSNYDYYGPYVPLGYWKYPDSSIFPNRTLEGMQVGVGDGTTVSFKPPLNLWVKDTEKIYVNGTLLVRGVDYTCDYRNNLDGLAEIRPSNFCKIHNTCTIHSGCASNYGCHPLKGGINKASSSSSDYSVTSIEWDAAHPLIWELEEDPQVGLEADYFQMNAILNTAGSGNYWKNATFIVSYSADGTEWTEAGRWTCTSNTTSASNKFEFPETIAAVYWKLDIDVSGCSDNIKNGRFYTNSVSYLHRNGSQIVFTDAPAADAIITMNADIDRPMKNSNFVIDVNPAFSFG